MAGITKDGFSIKRQIDIIEDLKQNAETIFRDLIPAGEIVDTSDSSALGRLIGLISLPLSDMWEGMQEVYSAFDPNSAYGVALDNLVMYGGLTRLSATRTIATAAIWGDPSTVIIAGSNVRAIDNKLFTISNTTTLNSLSCVGCRVFMTNVVEGQTYSVSVSLDSGTMTASKVAGAGETINDILSDIRNTLDASMALTAAVAGDELVVELDNINEKIDITLSNNLVFSKIKKTTQMISVDTGVSNYPEHSITAIATPTLGWDSVDNPFPAISGTDRETDDELRLRFRDSKFLKSQNLADSLYSGLVSLPGVRHAKIYENNTATTDPVYDIPSHTFKVLIHGGDDNEIARMIWLNTPITIGTAGSTTVVVKDSMDEIHTIKFSRPTFTPIYITIDLTTDTQFPADGVNRIKAALVDYFEDSFIIGQDVIYSRLFTPINSVIGHQVDSLKVGTTPSPSGTTNVPIDFDKIVSLSSANIIINIA